MRPPIGARGGRQARSGTSERGVTRWLAFMGGILAAADWPHFRRDINRGFRNPHRCRPASGQCEAGGNEWTRP
jgi:hypothetical protein